MRIFPGVQPAGPTPWGWVSARMVDVDGAKERDAIHLVVGIFYQHVLAKSALRIGPLINQSLPAFIGLGASTESNVAN